VSTSSDVDLVIIGAGAAGLAAARAATRAGLSHGVLEAMGRIGGRAHTDHATFGVPWDRGCHWLHSASLNPLRAVADLTGFRYRTVGSRYRGRTADGWMRDDEYECLDASAERCLVATLAAGERGEDVPCDATVDRDEPGYGLYRTWMFAEWGHDPADVSALDAARYRDTGEDYPVEDGYGALVAHHARGLVVSLDTPVTEVAWGGPGVRVTTPRGTVTARAAVVTVSTGILTSGSIRFDPPLPDWKLDAAEAVPLGRANKVAFAVPGETLGVSEPTAVVVPIGGSSMIVRLRPFGRDMADCYLAGPVCRELEDAGEREMVEACREALVAIFGTELRANLAASASTRWGHEPTILGAYAAAKPGRAHHRVDLARPVGDRLYFAGEATHPEFFSTCHGAHLSGIDAVRAVACALGRTTTSGVPFGATAAP